MSICLTLSNKTSDDSWKTKIPLIDGFGTEGIGSMIQYHLLMRFFTDLIDVDFTYPGSTNFSHHSYIDSSEKEYLDSIDSFFNFPNLKNSWDKVYNITDINEELFSLIESNRNSFVKVLINLSNCHIQLANLCFQNVSELFTKQRIDKIRTNLIFNGKKYFDENVNISLHIRTPNPNDLPQEISSPNRELYFYEKDFYRYRNLIGYLKEKFKDQQVTLHIHSQGFTTKFQEFLEFKTENFNIQLHIDDHPVSDLYHMSNADLFVMSNSSFSWIPSLLNSNKKIVRDNFTNGPFVHNAIKTNYDYTEIL